MPALTSAPPSPRSRRFGGGGRRRPGPDRLRRRPELDRRRTGALIPSGSVEMYVGASAGGSSDLISRAVSKGLSDDLGASFPVINREGANGALAAAEVAKAEPNG